MRKSYTILFFVLIQFCTYAQLLADLSYVIDGELLINRQVSINFTEGFIASQTLGPNDAKDEDANGYEVYSDCDEMTLDEVEIPSLIQCLEEFQKLAPEAMKSPYPHGYAESIDIMGNVAVVGIKSSDSLQLDAGLAYAYEYINNKWQKVATLFPSVPIPNMNFGTKVKITNNHIFISSRYTRITEPGASYTLAENIPGSIFIFEKPSTGWSTMSENLELSLKDGSYAIDVEDFEVSENENVIGLHDDSQLYFFKRNGARWGDDDLFVRFGDSNLGGEIKSLSIFNNTISISTYEFGESKVYLKRAVNNWTQLEDLQTISRPSNAYFNFGLQSILTRNHLLVSNWSIYDSIFLYSTDDDWSTIKPEIVLTSQKPLMNTWDVKDPENLFMNDTLIAITRNSDAALSNLCVYKKPTNGWVSKEEDSIIELPAFSHASRYAAIALTPFHLLIGAGLLDNTDVVGNNLLFYNLTDEPPELIENRTYDEANGTGMNFGKNAVVHENVLAVTTYNNNREIHNREEVHLHIKNPDKSWAKVNVISPETPEDASIDFGASISFYQDYLVIGAPNYQEADFDHPTGLVFVFKKVGNWSNVQKIAELRPSDWAESQQTNNGLDLGFGQNVSIHENTIIVTAPGKNIGTNEPEDHGMIYVFEKSSGKEWTSTFETARLYSEYASEYARIGSAFIFQDDCIITPHYWTTKYNNALVSVFKRPDDGWRDTVETYVHQIESTGSRTFNQGDIAVNNEMLFIGDPLYRYSQENKFGRIFILKKAGDDWSAIVKVNTLNYKQAVFRNYPISPFPAYKIGLGTSFDVVDNILIAGLDFMKGRGPLYDNLKGVVPVYQALDPNWENVELLTNLEGDNNFTMDGFGFRVMANKDDIIICAPEDNSESGYNTGAVYHFSMSPTLKLIEPICIDYGPIILSAYPENGQWSGKGILDGSENIFYPEVAGPGTHELAYSTPNCSYDGRMRITVEAREKPTFMHSINMEVCDKSGVKLEVDSINGVMYKWFYMSDLDQNIVTVNDNSSTIFVHDPGKYWVESYNVLCPENSDTVQVRFTPNPVMIDTLPIICDPASNVQISVAPDSGVWHSNAIIEDHIIMPSRLQHGLNELVYEFSASGRCVFFDTLLVEYDPLTQFITDINSFEICHDSAVAIALKMLPSTSYFLSDLDNSTELKINNSPFQIDHEGYYQIQINMHSCTIASNIFEVKYFQDSVFFPNVVTHNFDQINDQFEIYIENGLATEVSIYNRYGKLLYKNSNYSSSWPNKSYPSGIYYYECLYTTFCNPNKSTVKGWIQLLE